MIRQLKYGNPQVLGEMYRQYRTDFIVWMTANYQCSSDVARDIYQDTMITIIGKAQKGELDHLSCSLKTYLYGVAKNKYKEYLRKNGRHMQVEDIAWESLAKESGDDRTGPHLELVKRSLETLGDPCRSVLELYYYHGMSMEEIAKQLPYKNSNTVKNMKYKCLNKLKEIFNKIRVKEKL
ncbi:MAG: RNA polymerase sigma factor [Saprospiraceae bacterium]|nr:RNA polymerase sigma factor [Saprospiraceae bacterium]